MKLLHTADLHLGKKVNEFSMLEDQRYILERILSIIDEEKASGIILSGDIYDRSTPPADAVNLLDYFLSSLSCRDISVFIVAGNHDSGDRLSFLSSVLRKNNLYLAGKYDGSVQRIDINEGEDSASIYLMPFIKSADIRPFFPDEDIPTYTAAMRKALSAADLSGESAKILVSHQFVSGSEKSDSEEISSIGGLDNIDPEVFSSFDYVALGHLHIPQGDRIRYAGSPLKYSFSEVRKDKSITLIDIKGCSLDISEIPLVPLHDMKEISGTFDEVTSLDFYEGTELKNCYLRIILKDEDEIPEAIHKLRNIYLYVMRLEYDNRRTRENNELSDFVASEIKSPMDLIKEFYKKTNNSELSERAERYLVKTIEEIWSE